MTYWILSANKKYYDFHHAFEQLEFIDWNDYRSNFKVGDFVYIYSTNPSARVEFKCEVVATKIKFENMIDDTIYFFNDTIVNDTNNTYVRLKKVYQFETDMLSYKNLVENGLGMAPRKPIKLNSILKQYICDVENKIRSNLVGTSRRPFLLVDQGGESYNVDNNGFELFNETLNAINHKYYAYVPPYNTLNISNFGADRLDTFIDDIVVLFVTRFNEDSTDRLITGIYPSARAYKKPILDKKLQRTFLDKDGSTKSSSYSIESDTYLSIEHLSLVIETNKFNNYLFRGQRVYSGTNEKLDRLIYSYLELIDSDIKSYEDLHYQEEIKASKLASDTTIINAPNKKIEWIMTKSGKSVKRNSGLAKSAIKRANYKCEVDKNHTTFKNTNNEQYMEGHHLIPITSKNALFYENRFSKNIDCVENIVSICPNCHKAIHLGNGETKRKIIEKLYVKKIDKLKAIGIPISLEELFRLYNI